MAKEIAKTISLAGILTIVGCGDLEISYRSHVPEPCKAIAEDAQRFNDTYFPDRHFPDNTSKCAELAYAYDKTCTIPYEFQVLARNQSHAAEQYCLWLDLEAQ